MCCYKLGDYREKRFHLCLSFLHSSVLLLTPCLRYTCVRAVFPNSANSQFGHLELNLILGAFQATKKTMASKIMLAKTHQQ